MRETLGRGAGFALALVLALAAASLVLVASRLDVAAALGALFTGAFGSTQGIAETLAQTSTLIFAGLAVAVALRAGLFNIGAEGQLIVGGLCTAITGAALTLPAPIEIPVCLAAGALGGALYGGLAGWLRARFGASEVISTIMLNYVAIDAVNYLANGPLRGSAALPETAPIAATAMLPAMIPGTRLTLALPLAIVAAVLVAWWLARTVLGLELRAVGKSERAARYAGVDVGATLVRAMLLSGGLAGLAGATEVMGLVHRFNAELSPGFGFTSIAVALLAGANPLATVATALLFGALANGALAMQAIADVPKDAVTIVEGFVILFVAANWFGTFARLRGAASALPPVTDATASGGVT